jgi:EpsD family peptidyl-prolyl cis-trans isomerase
MNISTRAHAAPLVRFTGTLLAAAAVLTTGCGETKDKPATQTAAKVNKEEITVHQINFALGQQRGLRADQQDAARKQVLERLIDQELTLQKAAELKIDRDAKVQQQLEASRRDIISRAYLERVGETATRPTSAEVEKYYAEKPALFKERRIYNLQEIAIEAKPEQVATLRSKLQSAKNINEFVEYLKSNEFRFAGNQAVHDRRAVDAQSVTPRRHRRRARGLAFAAGGPAARHARHRAVPAQRAQARHHRQGSEVAARSGQDRVCRAIRRRGGHAGLRGVRA